MIEGYEWYQTLVINKLSDRFQFHVDLDVVLADGASQDKFTLSMETMTLRH